MDLRYFILTVVALAFLALFVLLPVARPLYYAAWLIGVPVIAIAWWWAAHYERTWK